MLIVTFLFRFVEGGDPEKASGLNLMAVTLPKRSEILIY
jgi:hypothetical protein